jgi:hypothetical protein
VSKRKDLAPARARRRPYSPRQRKKRFLLYCEGEVTERDYFQGFSRFLRSPLIEVKVAPEWRKDPKRLVELAKEARSAADREARLARDDSLRYDEVWCVFDCDEHARLKPAIDQATALELGLAVSNPCFDLWLLLHFQDQHAAITTKKAGDAVRGHVPRYVKHMDFARLGGRGSDAVKRAQQLDAICQRKDERYGNPTTGVWQLIVRLCEDSNVSVSEI